MAINEVYRDADHIPLPVPTGTQSGDPVAVGSLVGVAVTDRVTGESEATVWLKGAFSFDVDGAVTEVGQPLYIVADDTRQTQLTTTATDNTVFGYALETKTAAVSAIPVRIAQV